VLTERLPMRPRIKVSSPIAAGRWRGDSARGTSADATSLALESSSISPRYVRLAQMAFVLGNAALVAAAYLLHDGFRAELGRALAVLASGDGEAVGAYLRAFGVWAPVASLLLMVVQAVAAPVPAILVAFANGLTFGVVGGGLLTVAGQTLAAALCFGIARAVGRPPVEALAGKFGLETADRWFVRWGARGIVLTRLVPGLSFDVISYAAGLTGIRFGPFLAATAIGVAPQAFLYAYLIREAPQSAWLFYAASWLVVSAVVAIAVVRIRRQPSRSPRRRVESLPCPARPA
jgi:uncharacterized membrane protein YdjX (TVP38/TMEM64 family)